MKSSDSERLVSAGLRSAQDAAAAMLDVSEYGLLDVLSPDDVRAALGPFSDDKWEDIRARIPWSDALGARTLRIQWNRLLLWLAEHERKTA